MAALRDIVGYLCEHYPLKNELSKARLTKMVYLADWKSALEDNTQLSDIKWKFNHYGPYVDDVVNVAREDNAFTVISELNNYGDLKERIELKRPKQWASLTEAEIAILNHVITETRKLYWKDFIQLVYSTFPVMVSERQSILNLPELARRYRRDITSKLDTH